MASASPEQQQPQLPLEEEAAADGGASDQLRLPAGFHMPMTRPYPGVRGGPVLDELDQLVGSPDPNTLSDAERAQFNRQRSRTHTNLMKLLSEDRNVRFLVQAISDNGCVLRPNQFFQIKQCAAPSHGYFFLTPSSGKPGIVLCQNNLRTKGELKSTVFHELVHAYDFCSVDLKVDDCYHAACTEIRASALSGDCKMTQEWLRGNLGAASHHQKCVRRRAELSAARNVACKGKDNWQVVDQIFQRCYRDTAPFDGYYPWG